MKETWLKKLPLPLLEGPEQFKKGNTGFFQFHKRKKVLCLHF